MVSFGNILSESLAGFSIVKLNKSSCSNASESFGVYQNYLSSATCYDDLAIPVGFKFYNSGGGIVESTTMGALFDSGSINTIFYLSALPVGVESVACDAKIDLGVGCISSAVSSYFPSNNEDLPLTKFGAYGYPYRTGFTNHRANMGIDVFNYNVMYYNQAIGKFGISPVDPVK